MDRLIPGAIVFVVLLGLLLLMYLGWRGRSRRQRGLRAATVPEDAELGTPSVSVTGLYVSTTSSGEPLDRVTLPGLAFRGRATVSVFETGILVIVTGEPEIFIYKSRVRGVDTSTWTIDRVVEPDGLVRLEWSLDDDSTRDGVARAVDVESYFRIESSAESARLIDAIECIAPSPGSSRTPHQEGSAT